MDAITNIDDYRRARAMRQHPAGKGRPSKIDGDRVTKTRTVARKQARSAKFRAARSNVLTAVTW